MLRGRSSNALKAFRDELISLAEGVAKSVVTVRLVTSTLGGGTGSGWFAQPGVVVTNHHVVDGPSPMVKLRLKGGKVIPGEILGSDPLTDLAVIRCELTGAEPLIIREHQAHLGELCFAFGSPLGEYTESVTFGIVSGLDRRMPLQGGKSIENLLQTDAEINPGNSGGPLVDLDGQLLGVNVMIRTDGRGMGFAVPAATAQSIVPELLEHGSILRPRLGASLQVIDHWSDGIECERLRVSSAPEGHPLQRGDVLLAVAGRPITKRADLFNVMRRPLAGKETTLDVERAGVRQQIAILPIA
jgi:S1-C subfamily serine protease